MRALIGDLHAVERMLAEGLFERGVSRIGAEQELFLVDRAYHPAPGALKILERIDDTHFTTELGLYNLEMNADPQPFAGTGLARMEAQLEELYGKVRTHRRGARHRAGDGGHLADARARPISACTTWCRARATRCSTAR